MHVKTVSMDDVAVWLRRCHNVTQANPVRVTIQRGPASIETFDGVRYFTKKVRVETEREVTENRAKAGDIYHSEAVYIVGKLPKWYDKPKSAFTDGLGVDWYVACYGDEKALKKEYSAFHPFGTNWIIMPWLVVTEGIYKDWKIDTGEIRPYKRYKLTIE